MKKLFVSFVLFAVFSTLVSAQKEARYWYFGNSAGISFPYTNALPSAVTNSGMAQTPEGCATISDASGNLLFYTNGRLVWDKSHAQMPLPAPGQLGGHEYAAQSSQIIPRPGFAGQFYVFTVFHSKLDSIRYSLIDMSLPGNGTSSNPLGNGVSGMVKVAAPGQISFSTEMLTACKHANNTDFWVFAHDIGNAASPSRILVYKVTSAGVSLNGTFFDGSLLGTDHNGGMKVSPDRQKLAICYNESNKVKLYNFDASTGSLTLANTLTDITFLKNVYSAEFSPDSKVLYTVNTASGSGNFHYVSQFDLTQTTDAAILGSRYTVAMESMNFTSEYNGYGAIQLGPDLRIYVSRGGYPSLSYIDLPNNLGSSCNFVSNGISLSPGISVIGLPAYIPAGDSVKTSKPCDVFRLNPSDTMCCSAGISRTTAGNSNVVKISYQVTGGVIQGYSSSCAGTPVSTAVSGTASGTINFNPTCSLQLFTTSLQSTTASGTMTVTYTVKLQNGDSCIYTTVVRGCPRSPQIQCDKVKGEICVCNSGVSGINFLNLFISNTAIPVSPICGIIINYYNSSNVLDNTFFVNAQIMSPQSLVGLPGPINVSGNPFAAAGSLSPLNIQAYYQSNKVLNGIVEVITIHCNGDTCKRNWKPNGPKLDDLTYVNHTLKPVKSPFSNVTAYSFRLKGPSTFMAEPNPYKVKYLTISIPDSTGGSEIIGITGGTLFPEKEREFMLGLENSMQSRHTALLKIQTPLNLGPTDSSGIFQLFFANGTPRQANLSIYNEEGALLNTSSVTLDSGSSTGVLQLGKNGMGIMPVYLYGGHPNPTSDYFQLGISLTDPDDILIRIFDSSNKLVEDKNIGSLKRGLSEFKLDLSGLSNGTYLIQAHSAKGNENSNSIKVIVVR